MIQTLSIFYIFELIYGYSIVDYCSITCKKSKRISLVCENRTEKCYPGDEYLIGLTENERTLALNYHNEIRNKVAGGLINAKFMDGKAADMNVLSYSLELEFTAQCACNLMILFVEVEPIPLCHQSPKYSDTMLNQNFAYLFTGSFPDDEFMTQIKGFSADITLEKGGNPLQRMNWANSTEMGCGKTATYHKFYVCCLYNNGGEFGDPNGLDETNELYRRGEPCSECQGSDCNSKYTNLCGEIHPSKPFEPPFEMVQRIRAEDIPGKSKESQSIVWYPGKLIKYVFIIIIYLI